MPATGGRLFTARRLQHVGALDWPPVRRNSGAMVFRFFSKDQTKSPEQLQLRSLRAMKQEEAVNQPEGEQPPEVQSAAPTASPTEAAPQAPAPKRRLTAPPLRQSEPPVQQPPAATQPDVTQSAPQPQQPLTQPPANQPVPPQPLPAQPPFTVPNLGMPPLGMVPPGMAPFGIPKQKSKVIVKKKQLITPHARQQQASMARRPTVALEVSGTEPPAPADAATATQGGEIETAPPDFGIAETPVPLENDPIGTESGTAAASAAAATAEMGFSQGDFALLEAIHQEAAQTATLTSPSLPDAVEEPKQPAAKVSAKDFPFLTGEADADDDEEFEVASPEELAEQKQPAIADTRAALEETYTGAAQASGQQAAQFALPLEPQPARDAFTILIADDEPDIRTLMQAMLSDGGYNIVQADNGEDALRLWQEIKPDMVILDVQMPGKSGLEVCKAIKTAPTHVYTPVFLVTCLDDPYSKIDGLKMGADDYITKPFFTEELQLKVAGFLRIKELTDKLVQDRNELAEQEERLTMKLYDLGKM